MQLAILQEFLFLENLGKVPGNRLTFAVRIGREIDVLCFSDSLLDRLDVLLVSFHQRIAHVKIVIRVDCAFFRQQIAHVTIRGDDVEASPPDTS